MASKPNSNEHSLGLLQHDGGDPFRSNASRGQSHVSVYSHNKAQPEDIQKWLQFKIYSFWNIIRFLIVAVVICYSNYQNQDQIESYQKDCCKCYYISESPESYGISQGYRIDWSYCMPQCVDCTYCIQHYNNDGMSCIKVYNKDKIKKSNNQTTTKLYK